MEKILYLQCDFPVLQNRVYETPAQAKNCTIGDIKIVEHQQTGMVYNAAFRPELIVYDSTYNNEQGLSQHFRKHLAQVAVIIEDNLGKDNLVEVGCGKGFFLEMMLARGVDVTGFDSTYDGDNSRVVKKYFEPGIIAAPAKGLILRHVLEHIPNPVEFLFELKQANGGQGLIYIEVPCFDWICRKRAWFDIFYEHVNYFRLGDFFRMFSSVLKSGRFFGEQYLYVIADLATLRKPVFDESDAVDFPSDFLVDLSSAQQSTTEHPTCVWGGSSKGVIFSLLCERVGLHVDIVIDVNPAKQGLYLPGTGLRVWSPDAVLKDLPLGTSIYVMNSNYFDEIREMTNDKHSLIAIDL